MAKENFGFMPFQGDAKVIFQPKTRLFIWLNEIFIDVEVNTKKKDLSSATTLKLLPWVFISLSFDD